MVTIDIVVKSVVLLERSSGLAISSGEASQDEEYVLIKTRKSEKKKCVTGFSDTNSSQMQLFKFEPCSQKSTCYIDPNALCVYLFTCK